MLVVERLCDRDRTFAREGREWLWHRLAYSRVLTVREIKKNTDPSGRILLVRASGFPSRVPKLCFFVFFLRDRGKKDWRHGLHGRILLVRPLGFLHAYQNSVFLYFFCVIGDKKDWRHGLQRGVTSHVFPGGIHKRPKCHHNDVLRARLRDREANSNLMLWPI